MTYEQAQLYIKIFILQHYDENLEDIIPNVKYKGKVSDLVSDCAGDWKFRHVGGYVFFSSEHGLRVRGRPALVTRLSASDTTFNILDYINLEEETT